MSTHFPRRREVLRHTATLCATVAAPVLAQGSDELLIGQSAHLSGPYAPTLLAPLKGQELALEEFNRKGGVGGRRVRLLTLDDAYDPRRCQDNVGQLIERERVLALYGLASTANVASVLPLLAERRVPLVGVYTGAPALRLQHHPYFFTTMASYRGEVAKMITNLVTIQSTRIALAYHNTPFGQLMMPEVEAAAKELGATIVARQPLEVSGQNSEPACRALAAASPHAVILVAFGPAIVPFVRASRRLIGVPVYALSIANARSTLDALGDDARGMVFTATLPNPLRATTPLTRDYWAAMERAGTPADYDHFLGYVNMRVLLEGLRRAGKGVTPDSLVSTLESAASLDLGGYVLNFSAQNHHGSNFVDLLVIGANGRFIR